MRLSYRFFDHPELLTCFALAEVVSVDTRQLSLDEQKRIIITDKEYVLRLRSLYDTITDVRDVPACPPNHHKDLEQVTRRMMSERAVPSLEDAGYVHIFGEEGTTTLKRLVAKSGWKICGLCTRQLSKACFTREAKVRLLGVRSSMYLDLQACARLSPATCLSE